MRFPFTINSSQRNAMLCALFSTACVLATRPFAAMGFIDDWSYIKSAQVFASTGHFVFNGWAAAMLGWQIPLGALFIKIFGFSFTAARFALLPIAMLAVYLFHQVLVNFGITPWNAAFGTLTLALSPAYLPLSFSFMSDIPGQFVVILCIYLCQRAVLARDAGSTILWLAAAAATNVAGGTVRQVTWLGVLVIVPCTALLLRKRPGVLVATAVLWILSLPALMRIMRWFHHQPYSFPETTLAYHITIHHLHHLEQQLLRLFVCFVVLLVPLLAGWLIDRLRQGAGARIRLAIALAVAVGGGFLAFERGLLSVVSMPWLEEMIATLGVAEPMLGQRAITLNRPVRLTLILLAAMCFFALCDQLIALAYNSAFGISVQHSSKSVDSKSLSSWTTIFWLLGPFTAAYLVALFPVSLIQQLFDRYLIELMAVAIILLLKLYQENISDRLPAVCAAVLAVFTFYAMAQTHDIFAMDRTRVQAASHVLAASVPRTDLEGGFNYDGWTEIEASGYVNDKRIAVPAHAYRPWTDPLHLSPACSHWFAEWTPSVTPTYFLVRSAPLPCLASSQFSPVSYSAWLPPFQRQIFIQTVKAN